MMRELCKTYNHTIYSTFCQYIFSVFKKIYARMDRTSHYGCGGSEPSNKLVLENQYLG